MLSFIFALRLIKKNVFSSSASHFFFGYLRDFNAHL